MVQNRVNPGFSFPPLMPDPRQGLPARAPTPLPSVPQPVKYHDWQVTTGDPHAVKSAYRYRFPNGYYATIKAPDEGSAQHMAQMIWQVNPDPDGAKRYAAAQAYARTRLPPGKLARGMANSFESIVNGAASGLSNTADSYAGALHEAAANWERDRLHIAKPYTAGDVQRAVKQVEDDDTNSWTAAHPIGNFIGNVEGGVINPAGAVAGRWSGEAPTIGQQMTRGGIAGMGVGAVTGAVSAPDGERVHGALNGARFGGVAGYLTPPAAVAVGKLASQAFDAAFPLTGGLGQSLDAGLPVTYGAGNPLFRGLESMLAKLPYAGPRMQAAHRAGSLAVQRVMAQQALGHMPWQDTEPVLSAYDPVAALGEVVTKSEAGLARRSGAIDSETLDLMRGVKAARADHTAIVNGQTLARSKGSHFTPSYYIQANRLDAVPGITPELSPAGHIAWGARRAIPDHIPLADDGDPALTQTLVDGAKDLVSKPHQWLGTVGKVGARLAGGQVVSDFYDPAVLNDFNGFLKSRIGADTAVREAPFIRDAFQPSFNAGVGSNIAVQPSGAAGTAGLASLPPVAQAVPGPRLQWPPFQPQAPDDASPQTSLNELMARLPDANTGVRPRKWPKKQTH